MGGPRGTRSQRLAGGPAEAVPLPPWAATAGIALAGVAAALVALSAVSENTDAARVFVLLVLAGALLALRPWWIVPAFVALTWTAAPAAVFGGLPSPIELSGLALLAVALVVAPSRPRATGQVALVAALLALPMIASALLSGADAGMPVERLKDLAFLPIPALLLRTGRDVERVVQALVAVGVFLGAGAAWSVLVAPSTLFPLTEPIGPLDPEAPRAAGPFGEPNFFALTLAVLVPLALHLLSTRRGAVRVLGGVAVPVLFAGIFATGSRGGLLAAGIAFVAFAIVSGGRGPRIAAVALGVVAVALLPLFAAQTSSSADRTVGGRLVENQIAVVMFAEHPVTGVGAGAYPEIYRDYSRQIGDDPRPVRAAHSLPLEVLSEQGIAGALGWLAAAIVVVGAAAAAGVWRRPLGRALGLALCAYLVGSVFLHGDLLRLLMLLVGLLIAYAAVLRAPEEARAS